MGMRERYEKPLKQINFSSLGREETQRRTGTLTMVERFWFLKNQFIRVGIVL